MYAFFSSRIIASWKTGSLSGDEFPSLAAVRRFIYARSFTAFFKTFIKHIIRFQQYFFEIG